jgi:hypothetical protein
MAGGLLLNSEFRIVGAAGPVIHPEPATSRNCSLYVFQ